MLPGLGRKIIFQWENTMQNALLVSYNVSQWSIKRTDRDISRQVASVVKGNEDKVGRFVKNLIDPKAPEYVAICRARDLGRKIHYSYTLPWQDGVRLLNAQALDSYVQQMQRAKAIFDDAVNLFVEAYPSLIVAANRALSHGKQSYWRESDYPPAETIRAEFNLYWEISPVPSGGQFDDIAALIGAAQAEKLAADMAEANDKKWAKATKAVWQRLYDVLSHASQQLNHGERIHDSVMNNLSELCDLLPILNVSKDPELDQRRRELQAVLRSYSAQSVKDKGNRQSCASEVDAILARINII